MTAAPLTISVLTVGDELLSGEVVDTNLPSIARALSELGLAVARHVTAADDIEDIARWVRELCRESDAVIVTGGLGPTNDDLTCEAVARAAGLELVHQPHLERDLRAFFEAMGRPMVEENLKQAFLPAGSMEIPPAGGTAAGFMLELDGALVAVLPGVPREMDEMMASHVVPELSKRHGGGEVTVTRRLMTFGAGESDVANLLSDLIGKGPVRYGFLAQSGPIVVKLTACAASQREALEIIGREQALATERLGALLYATDEETMEEVVGRLLRESGKTLAVAESLTAGMVCARIANVPGSSDYFLGGVVAYSSDSKREILDIPDELLADGAVNTAVAEAMAQSVRRLFGSDIAVSTTGVAGPGQGGESKPPGTACVALAHPGGVVSLERRLPGYRQMVRNIATMAALNAVRLYLS